MSSSSERLIMSKKTGEKRLTPQLRKTFALVLPIAACGILLDRVTKILAVSFLKGHPPVDIIRSVIRLNYAENTGAAFNLFRGQRTFFIFLTVAVLAFVAYALYKGWIRNTFGYCSVGLCISGAIGNFTDRLLYGYVVDMFEPTFIRFAIFNVADICLTIGGILLAVYLLFFHDKASAATSTDVSAADEPHVR